MKIRFILAFAALWWSCLALAWAQISECQVKNISNISARVVWVTDAPASSFVDLWLGEPYLNYLGRYGSTLLVLTHEVFLRNLAPLTDYSVKACSRMNDSTRPEYFSNLLRFRTLADDIIVNFSLAEELLPEPKALVNGQKNVLIFPLLVANNNISDVYLTRLTFRTSSPIDSLVYNFYLKNEAGQTLAAVEQLSRDLVVEFSGLNQLIEQGTNQKFYLFADIQKGKKSALFSFKLNCPDDVKTVALSGQTVKTFGQVSSNRFSVAPNTAIEVEGLERTAVLSQSYPNPFQDEAAIAYEVVGYWPVSLKIFNACGREELTLVNETKIPGQYVAKFSGQNLKPGEYFYVLRIGDIYEIRKMILLK